MVLFQGAPKRLIETGTLYGDGTTKVIAEYADNEEGCQFVTIESNIKHRAVAKSNLEKYRNTQLLAALTVPSKLLPTLEETQADIDRTPSGLYIDNPEIDSAAFYVEESKWEQDIPDSGLRLAFETLGGCDFVLLDSAGHLGWIEFNVLLSLMKSPCIVTLDDVDHIKHYRSFEYMQSRPRQFELLHRGRSRFGFSIHKFKGSSE